MTTPPGNLRVPGEDPGVAHHFASVKAKRPRCPASKAGMKMRAAGRVWVSDDPDVLDCLYVRYVALRTVRVPAKTGRFSKLDPNQFQDSGGIALCLPAVNSSRLAHVIHPFS